MSVITAKENFTVSPSILINVIMQQAGTLDKAILEAVMNELDAKCKRVSIEISDDMKRVVISGDGHGFKSVDDIKSLFGEFGFDHETEEELSRGRRFGRYGIGRGQLFKFGKSTWSTNQFKMVVDLLGVKSKTQLPYTIETHPQVLHEGCKIELDLYEAMSTWSLDNLMTDLRSMVKYMDVDVYLNGAKINKCPGDVKWDCVKDPLRFKKARSGNTSGLSVYNEGAFIKTFPHYKFGVSGEVTSVGKTFDVNMARNDIQSDCALLAAMKEMLKPYAEIKKKKNSLNKEDRIFFLKRTASGEVRYDDFLKTPVICNIRGRYVTIDTMYNHAKGRIAFSPNVSSQEGGSAHNAKYAFVVSPETLDVFEVDTFDEFLETFKSLQAAALHHRREYRELEVIPFGIIEEAFKSENSVITADKYTDYHKVVLATLENLSRTVAHYLPSDNKAYVNNRIKIRKVMLGRSEKQDTLAWTNGSDYIVFDYAYAKKELSAGVRGIMELATTMIHEYCHDDSSVSSHDHGPEFDAAFREAIERSIGAFYMWANDIGRTYLSEKNKKKLAFTNQDQRNYQFLGTIFDSLKLKNVSVTNEQ